MTPGGPPSGRQQVERELLEVIELIETSPDASAEWRSAAERYRRHLERLLRDGDTPRSHPDEERTAARAAPGRARERRDWRWQGPG